jgi:hypothetical protein
MRLRLSPLAKFRFFFFQTRTTDLSRLPGLLTPGYGTLPHNPMQNPSLY